jgi:hypothetical protein
VSEIFFSRPELPQHAASGKGQRLEPPLLSEELANCCDPPTRDISMSASRGTRCDAPPARDGPPPAADVLPSLQQGYSARNPTSTARPTYGWPCPPKNASLGAAAQFSVDALASRGGEDDGAADGSLPSSRHDVHTG